MEPWRRNLILMLVAAFLSLVGFNFVFPFLPLFVQQLGIVDPKRAAVWSGAIIGVSGLVSTVAQPIWGHLADRRGRKAMLLRAIFGAGAALMLMSLARNVWQLMALRGLFGALSGTNPSTNTLIAATVPRSHLGRSLGWLQTVGQLSNTLGPVLGGLMATVFGLRGAFVAAGGIAVAAGAIAIFGVHELPRSDEEQRASVATSEQRAPIRWRPLFAPLLALASMLLAVQMFSPVMPALVATARNQPQSAGSTGIAVGLLGLASAAGALSVGRPERRFGAERTLILGAVLAVLAELVLFAAHDWLALLVGLAVLGVGQGLVLPMGSALLAMRSDHSRLGAVFGIASAVQSAGFAGGPVVGGTLAAVFGLRFLPPAGALLLLLGILPILAATTVLRPRAKPHVNRVS